MFANESTGGTVVGKHTVGWCRASQTAEWPDLGVKRPLFRSALAPRGPVSQKPSFLRHRWSVPAAHGAGIILLARWRSGLVRRARGRLPRCPPGCSARSRDGSWGLPLRRILAGIMLTRSPPDYLHIAS